MNRIAWVLDGVDRYALYTAGGSKGPVPLDIPMAAATSAATGPRPQPAPIGRTQVGYPTATPFDPYAGDPVGRELGLPPRVTGPSYVSRGKSAGDSI